ncbi:hypothetical protein TNCV_2050631 [Trichonephila clavipes]|nr:hypothetical protein TNCV_2050631 [Trichonephila clavipes]
MAASSSSFIPTPLAHAGNLGEGRRSGEPLQRRPTKFNLYNPERRDQEPKDFTYDLIKLQKELGLGMSEEALLDHTFV